MSSIQINLLPDIVLKRRHEAKVKQWALAALIAWVTLVALASLGMLGYGLLQGQRLKSAKAESSALDKKVNSAENVAFRKEAQEVQASLSALDALYTHQVRNSAVFDELAAITPKTVKLTSIQVSGTAVAVSGSGTSYAEVGKMVASMKQSATLGGPKKVSFSNIVFNGSSLTGTGATFSLSMSFVYPEDTSLVNN